MARDKAQTRLDADTVDALKDYCDDADLTRSEAMRRAIRRYLADEGYPVPAADGAGIVNSRLDELENTLETRLDELETREARHRRQRETIRRTQTGLAAAVVAYVAITVALPPLGTFVRAAWAVVGLGLAAALLVTTRHVWGDPDE